MSTLEQRTNRDVLPCVISTFLLLFYVFYEQVPLYAPVRLLRVRCSVTMQHALRCPDAFWNAVNIFGFFISALDARERAFSRLANCTPRCTLEIAEWSEHSVSVERPFTVPATCRTLFKLYFLWRLRWMSLTGSSCSAAKAPAVGPPTVSSVYCSTSYLVVSYNKQTNYVQHSSSWEAAGSQLVKKFPPSPHFMEPECSLPHTQATATCSYPEPDQSSPWSPIPLLEDPF